MAELSISRRTAQKITQVHGITEGELRDAVECVQGLDGRWDDDPERGRRALIDVTVRGRSATVVLYPATHPMGMLGSWAVCTSLTTTSTKTTSPSRRSGRSAADHQTSSPARITTAG